VQSADLVTVGALLIALNTAAAFSCIVTLLMYGKVLFRAYAYDEAYKWTSWMIVLSALAGVLFFGSFALIFHFGRAPPLSSSLAPLPIRFAYLSLTLASTACAVAARYRDTPMGARRTFVLWSLLIAAGVVLLTSYEAGV
jgi:hypothetical protein